MKEKWFVLFLWLPLFVFAQKASEGEMYFNNKQYGKARDIYESLLSKRPNDALYNYRLARCCYELKDNETAIKHFEISGNKYPMRNLYLGELYFDTYRFDESVSAYNTYLSTLKPGDKMIPELEKKIRKSQIGADLITKVNDIAIVDSLVVNKSDFLRFYKFSSDLGTLTREPLKLTSKKTVDKIKYTTQRQDRVYFSDSIHGQMDIFTSYKLLDKWSSPVSVSKLINTPANENYPFLLLDGVTLYFASDGENSLGGYDIFMTKYMATDDSFLKPENIGFPFNSPYNDYMMVIDDVRKIGWFASDRYQPNGKVTIYTFIPNDIKTIIRSEDKDYIRRAAMLKVYRKAKLRPMTTRTDIDHPQDLQQEENGMNFVVNDSVVYSSVSQFRSPDALKMWPQLHKMITDLSNGKLLLNELRQKYSLTDKAEEQAALKSQIIHLEANNNRLAQDINSITVRVRNAENEFLRGLEKQ